MNLKTVINKNKILFTVFFLFTIFHLYHITAPPNGSHKWRESDTAAVILNYYQEDMSFLEPRINQRGATSGITGMEFPIYNYSVAVLYKIFGPYHSLARSLTLFAALLCIWIFYGIVRHLSGDKPAQLACWAFAFSPLFFFYSYKIMPDILMLMLLLGAIRFYLQYIKEHNYLYWVFSAVFLAISSCIKPLGLCIYLPFLYLLVREKKQLGRQLLIFGIYIVISCVPFFVWIQYVRWLQAEHKLGGFYLGGSGLANFVENLVKYLFNEQFPKRLFFQWPLEFWIGWAIVPLFLIGAYYIRYTKEKFFYLLWILGIYLVFIPTALKSSTHDYYTLIMVPPMAVISGIGMYELFKSGGWKKAILICLLIISPIISISRMSYRFESVDDFYQIRQATERAIPKDSLVMVEDKTPAVKLYQLNRKGWPLRKEITYCEVKKYVQMGGQYLILNKPLDYYDDSLRWIFLDSTIKLGPLFCYIAELEENILNNNNR